MYNGLRKIFRSCLAELFDTSAMRALIYRMKEETMISLVYMYLQEVREREREWVGMYAYVCMSMYLPRRPMKVFAD